MNSEDSSDIMTTTLEENASSFSALYKNTNKTPQKQNQRRRKILEHLKKRRNELIDCKRGINDVYDMFENGATEMEVCPENISHVKKKKARLAYKLMLSEWFIEIPDDLEENWLMKICPVGKRSLVIADKGKTKVFSRTGKQMQQCSTLLPGGNEKYSDKFTVLDCIWERQRNIYFVLDIIAWDKVSAKDCDAAFRFFWLQSKFAENPQLEDITEENKAQFYPVPYDKATRSVIQESMSVPYMLKCDKTPVDGVLFYHKDCHYLKGFNPLVGWLKPFMLPSELGVEVNEEYLLNVPMDYINLENYLANKENRAARANKKK